MKRLILLSFFVVLFFCSIQNNFGQEKETSDNDLQLKEILYKKYKKEVQAFDKKEFDVLFFEFFKKKKEESLILNKDEFYTYTIKIAIYTEKLGLLYKDQKEESLRTKQEWFDKKYSDYLQSKK